MQPRRMTPTCVLAEPSARRLRRCCCYRSDLASKPMRTHRQRAERTQRGQAVVEFALVMPVLLLLLAGAVDLGNGFQTYIALTNAAREGAHYGINYSSGVCTRVQQVLPGLSVTCNAYYAVNADG